MSVSGFHLLAHTHTEKRCLARAQKELCASVMPLIPYDTIWTQARVWPGEGRLLVVAGYLLHMDQAIRHHMN